ncbi:hypothetical protein ARMGADRAFT_1026449 [Armillaria gallica]|uniref:Uncharacterized protein n=1 Tax=Armillaria gallica TaxID=47427 RepID=A0A2H3E5M4_ARMGA|nr:hypothetical protein ARMGADRAFT_1026449 [Armillaria gallica]
MKHRGSEPHLAEYSNSEFTDRPTSISSEPVSQAGTEEAEVMNGRTGDPLSNCKVSYRDGLVDLPFPHRASKETRGEIKLRNFGALSAVSIVKDRRALGQVCFPLLGYPNVQWWLTEINKKDIGKTRDHRALVLPEGVDRVDSLLDGHSTLDQDFDVDGAVASSIGADYEDGKNLKNKNLFVQLPVSTELRRRWTLHRKQWWSWKKMSVSDWWLQREYLY